MPAVIHLVKEALHCFTVEEIDLLSCNEVWGLASNYRILIEKLTNAHGYRSWKCKCF